MSELFEINSSVGSYKVNISKGCVTSGDFFSNAKDSCLIVDKNVRQLWSQIFDGLTVPIYVLDTHEENKTLIKAGEIIEWMRSIGLTKNTHIYAIGGGVVQDLSTFVSSIYMRGVDWTYVPTTLLGMVDSCIGGKSSINVGSYKNIAGNFYPPNVINIDVGFCQTLSKNEIIAGLSEAVKITYANENDNFEKYLTYQINTNNTFCFDVLSGLVELTLKTKKKFVEEDEFDKGVRQLLNFGHSIGHAIEASSGYEITHGVAVGVGMLAEIELSKHFFLTKCLPDRSLKLIQYLKTILSNVENLGAELKKISAEVALGKFKSDKKHSHDKYALITVDKYGYLKKILVEKNVVTDKILKDSFLNLHKIL